VSSLTAALAVTLAVLTGCSAGRSPAERAVPPARQGSPLKDPPQYVSTNGLLRVRIVVERRQVRLGGHRLWALTYNGFSMPPTLRLRPGDRMDFTMVNKVKPFTELRVHGLHVSPVGDSHHVLLRVHPDASLHDTFSFPSSLSPGTYWYHTYGRPHATSDATGGMSGIIVVDGLRQHLPPTLQNITEHVMALQEIQTPHDAGPGGDAGTGGPAGLVNGQSNPVIPIRPGETQLWRLANISTEVYYRLHLQGQRFRVVAQDANPVDQIWSADSLLIPAGARYDVLVQGGHPGRARLESLPYGQGSAGGRSPRPPIATAVSAGIPVRCAALPAVFASMEDLTHARIASRNTVVVTDGAAGQQYDINGLGPVRDDRVDIGARPGTVQEWTVHNASPQQRTFHVHTHRFQLMSVNGRNYAARSWQDTVYLPGYGHVVIRLRFHHTGKAVLHCHIRNEEDMGTMAVLEM
jgi:suppressor of ftsI